MATVEIDRGQHVLGMGGVNRPSREVLDRVFRRIAVDWPRELPRQRDEQLLQHLDARAALSRVPQSRDESNCGVALRPGGRVVELVSRPRGLAAGAEVVAALERGKAPVRCALVSMRKLAANTLYDRLQVDGM